MKKKHNSNKLNDFLKATKQLAESGDNESIALWSLCIIELDLKDQFVTQEFLEKVVENKGKDSNSWLWELITFVILYRDLKSKRILIKTNSDLDISRSLLDVIYKAYAEYEYDSRKNKQFDFFITVQLNLQKIEDWTLVSNYTQNSSNKNVFSTSNELDNKTKNKLISCNKTLSYLREIAEKNAVAQYILGILGNKGWLIKSSNNGFLLASYYLGYSYLIGIIFDKDIEVNYQEAINYFDRVKNSIDVNPDGFSNDFLFDLLRSFLDDLMYAAKKVNELNINEAMQNAEKEIAIQKVKLEKDHEIAVQKAKSETIENMMAMFAHQFRGSIGSLTYNAEHLNDKDKHLNLARSMNGLLELFSIVSTKPEILSSKLTSDVSGNNTPEKVLLQTLKFVIIDLLAKKNQTRISPYYLHYAKRYELVDDNLKLKDWFNNHSLTSIKDNLQSQWESDITKVFMSDDLHILNEWLKEHFLPIKIIGFNKSKAVFSMHGSKNSLLTVIFSEIILNAIKHSVPEADAPLLLSWIENKNTIEFSCQNQSNKQSRRRETSKGSGRGLKFMGVIAEHINGQFDAQVNKDDSQVTIKFDKVFFGESNE